MARASNLVIGTATLAVIAVAFGGLLGVQKWRTIQSRSQLRVVFEGGSASGLRRGGPVNFDGVPAGQILSIKLDNPRKIVALVMLDNAAPIRKDTVAGIEFQGLTGVAAISLIGGAPSAPPVPLDVDGIPVLTADLSDAESIVDTLHNVDRTIVSNAPAIKDGLRTFEDYTADLRSKGAEIDYRHGQGRHRLRGLRQGGHEDRRRGARLRRRQGRRAVREGAGTARARRHHEEEIGELPRGQPQARCSTSARPPTR